MPYKAGKFLNKIYCYSQMHTHTFIYIYIFTMYVMLTNTYKIINRCLNNVDSIKEQCAGTTQQVRLPQSPPPVQIQIINIRQVPTIVTQVIKKI